ncbi:hypothetical protein CACET_c02620 [Clostridium aceticum]|uniref:DUF8042 domain-containing protein n=1 Tax=Clostridium aceticum TaxID=84022 RepID=A0A0D8I995_9CLOT|nr:hypothetical protein [Clostridium aceticum]AKL93778.1 hypothetical protein CACET_c02620 [Clostridium aceticum]KJF25816.1 hypothetical protein TZ02_16580 [Clostridium aceticum]
MDKYIEVMKQILPLLETIEEGFSHIQNQLTELRYEEALAMLQDVIEGIASIDGAMKPIYEELMENNISNLSLLLKESISKAIHKYKRGKEINLEIQVQNEIIPVFTDWKREIEKTLKPYVVS